MDDDKRLKKKKKSSIGNIAIYLSLGIEMALIVLLCVGAGIALDNYVGWKVPILTLVMAFVGMFASIWILLKILKNKN